MAKKLILIISFLFLYCSVVSAFGVGGVVIGLDPVFTIKSGSCIELLDICDNCTSMNVTSLFLPNSTLIVLNETMEQHTVEFNYTYCTVDLEGIYYYTTCSDLDGEYDCMTYPFLVTYSGKSLEVGQSILYTILMGIFILFFVLILFFLGKLPDESVKEVEGELISYSWLKYVKSTLLFVEWILLIAIFYLTSNLAFAYLNEQLIAKTLFVIYRVCFSLTIPIILVWFIWIFYSVFKDKRMKRLIEKGIFPTQGGNW